MMGQRREGPRSWEGSGARRDGDGAEEAREKDLARSAREDGSGEGSDGEHQWKKCRAREEAAPQRRRTASRRCGEEGSRPEPDSAAASLCGSEWWRRRSRYACSAEEARLGSPAAAVERPRRRGTKRRCRMVGPWPWRGVVGGCDAQNS
jgi:hypothetical protein